MPNSKITTLSEVPTLELPQLKLNATQFAHFTNGDGLHLVDAEGDVIAFIHETSLEGNPRDADESYLAIRETKASLCALESLIVNQQGYLELNNEATEGLASLLSQMQIRLTL